MQRSSKRYKKSVLKDSVSFDDTIPITPVSAKEMIHTTSQKKQSSLSIGRTYARNIALHLRIWTKRRPFVGSMLIMLAGILVLWGPVSLREFAFLPGNTLWGGFLVGGMLLLMGLLQLFAPSYALLTGSISIVFALISLFAALGGFGLGMILGIIGGAQGVAWKQIVYTQADYLHMLEARTQQKHKRPWWRKKQPSATTQA